jgi:hypothetical protein
MTLDAHFIWLGHHFPWVHWLALASASERGEMDRVLVHHTDSISSEWWPAAKDLPRVEARRLEPEALLESVGDHAGELIDLFRLLRRPAARSNVLRAALLYTQGGIYLDFDTVTLRPLAPLLDDSDAFCGAERLAFPFDPHRRRDVRRLATAWARTGARDLLRRLPDGWRWFRRVERLYPAAVNNAIMGCRPGHALFRELLARMATTPERQRRSRYGLGTHLLQQTVQDYDGDDLVIHPPEVFYPLGPEISEHWFRRSHARLSQLVAPATRVVHWYASVRAERLVPKIDPIWVHENHRHEPFSALALPFLDPLDPPDKLP